MDEKEELAMDICIEKQDAMELTTRKNIFRKSIKKALVFFRGVTEREMKGAQVQETEL